MDPADFMAMLDPTLRQSVLRDAAVVRDRGPHGALARRGVGAGVGPGRGAPGAARVAHANGR